MPSIQQSLQRAEIALNEPGIAWPGSVVTVLSDLTANREAFGLAEPIVNRPGWHYFRGREPSGIDLESLKPGINAPALLLSIVFLPF